MRLMNLRKFALFHRVMWSGFSDYQLDWFGNHYSCWLLDCVVSRWSSIYGRSALRFRHVFLAGFFEVKSSGNLNFWVFSQAPSIPGIFLLQLRRWSCDKWRCHLEVSSESCEARSFEANLFPFPWKPCNLELFTYIYLVSWFLSCCLSLFRFRSSGWAPNVRRIRCTWETRPYTLTGRDRMTIPPTESEV